MSETLPRLGLATVLALALALALAAGSVLAASVPDPTRPAILRQAEAAPGAEPRAGLLLQSTLVSPRQRSAIINGQRYRIGDRIGAARIEAIGPGWVRLATPTGPSELRLSFPPLTQPVNR